MDDELRLKLARAASFLDRAAENLRDACPRLERECAEMAKNIDRLLNN